MTVLAGTDGLTELLGTVGDDSGVEVMIGTGVEAEEIGSTVSTAQDVDVTTGSGEADTGDDETVAVGKAGSGTVTEWMADVEAEVATEVAEGAAGTGRGVL